MERKSIGSFIAALRKANGLTQKELAEKLNVSDKSVSRWERDESAPDLMLIPVLAEVFGVTSDELLRGERMVQDEMMKDKVVSSSRTEKQLDRLLSDCKQKFFLRSMISVALCALGLIAAMICNFGFLRAYLGFFIGGAFFVTAAICEIVFYRLAYDAVDVTEYEGEKITTCKKTLIDNFFSVMVGGLMAFASTLPLIVLPEDTYLGVTGLTWLIFGVACAVIVGIIAGLFGKWKLEHWQVKKGFMAVGDEEKEKFQAWHKKRVDFVWRVVGIYAVLILLHIVFNDSRVESFATGTTFASFDAFKVYMETDVTNAHNSDTEYFDEYGNPIPEEEALTEYVYTDIEESEVLCEFVRRNETVVMYEIGAPEDGYLPIKVYTNEDMQYGKQLKETINLWWFILYGVILVVAGVKYCKAKP